MPSWRFPARYRRCSQTSCAVGAGSLTARPLWGGPARRGRPGPTSPVHPVWPEYDRRRLGRGLTNPSAGCSSTARRNSSRPMRPREGQRVTTTDSFCGCASTRPLLVRSNSLLHPSDFGAKLAAVCQPHNAEAATVAELARAPRVQCLTCSPTAWCCKLVPLLANAFNRLGARPRSQLPLPCDSTS